MPEWFYRASMMFNNRFSIQHSKFNILHCLLEVPMLPARLRSDQSISMKQDIFIGDTEAMIS